MSYLPAFPQERADRPEMQGLSKREYACIHCGVPASGDPELDAIIAEGNRIQKAMIDAPLESYGDSDYPNLTKINVE